jgi:hypothetical protein
LQGFLVASLPSPDLQGRGSANLYYQMGAKKIFLKGKADAGLNFAAPFNNYWPYRNTTNTPTFAETNLNYAYQRCFRFALSYRFGQAQQGKRCKSISKTT